MSPLDEIKQRQICAIISVGGSRRTAANYVDCAPTTIRRTATRDPAFQARLKHAESNLEVIHLSNIQSASKKSWRASPWILERLYPERYARRPAATIAVEQISSLLAQFADIIIDEVPDAAARRNLMARFEALTADLEPAESD